MISDERVLPFRPPLTPSLFTPPFYAGTLSGIATVSLYLGVNINGYADKTKLTKCVDGWPLRKKNSLFSKDGNP